eukprot:357826-Chlamydomonas_euryale.AAC.11
MSKNGAPAAGHHFDAAMSERACQKLAKDYTWVDRVPGGDCLSKERLAKEKEAVKPVKIQKNL